MSWCAFVVATAIALAFAEARVSYENYKVYSLAINNDHHFQLLSKFEQNQHYDFWTPLVRNGTSDIMVSIEAQWFFENFLDFNGIDYSIRIENVEEVFKNERIRQERAPKTIEGRISFTKYHRYSDILAYVNQLAKDHKDIVKVQTIGKTTEGRDMVVVKISSGGSNKPEILIDGGIHAREWIAHAQVLYILQELVENKNNRDLIKNVDWHIIPVINPDGYEYSHTNDRMWRKTRSKGTKCYGVDGNRNFDYHWGEAGTSGDECSQIYRGPKAFSEPETRALRDYVQKHPRTFKLYLTFHSYGQYLLYPWSYASVLPPNAKELQSVGDSAAQAIQKVNGTKYKVGASTAFMGATAGSSDDWAMGVGKIQLSYTVELPGGGKQGFDMPPERIVPVTKETFEGVKVFLKYVETLK